MIDLQPHADGVVLPVRAHASARRNAIGGAQDGELKVVRGLDLRDLDDATVAEIGPAQPGGRLCSCLARKRR